MEKVAVSLHDDGGFKGESITTICVQTPYNFSAPRLKKLITGRSNCSIRIEPVSTKWGHRFNISFLSNRDTMGDGSIVDKTEAEILATLRAIEEQIEAGRMIQEALDAIDKS